MNAKDRYSALLEYQKQVRSEQKRHEESIKELQKASQDLQDDLDRQIQEVVTRKLDYLHHVGRSVVKKTMGNPIDQRINTTDFPKELYWIFGFKKVTVSPSTMFVRASRKYPTRYVSDREVIIDIPISYLSMSDRDFAKEVRKAVRAIKEKERMAKEQKASGEVAALNRKIKALQKQVKELESK